MEIIKGVERMNDCLIRCNEFYGYYTCPCGKRYTTKIIKCECGLLFENFHQTYVPKKKELKK